MTPRLKAGRLDWGMNAAFKTQAITEDFVAKNRWWPNILLEWIICPLDRSMIKEQSWTKIILSNSGIMNQGSYYSV